MKPLRKWPLAIIVLLSPIAQAADTTPLVIHPVNGEVEYNPRAPIIVKCIDDSVDMTADTLHVMLDGKDVSKQCERLSKEAVYVPKLGLVLGQHNLAVKATDINGKSVSAEALFTIGKETTEPLVVKFNIGENTLLPSNMTQMWLQGDCSQGDIKATVSVNLGPEQAMNVRGKTIGSLVQLEDKNLFIVTVSNTVTHCHYTYLPGN